MQARMGTIVCKFGGDPAVCLIEEAICAKCLQTDGQTDGRRTPRDCISSWNELKLSLSKLALCSVSLYWCHCTVKAS